MQTVIEKKSKIKIELSFEDFLSSIDHFSASQKMQIFEKLRIETFKTKLNKISAEIKSPHFSEEEIMKEVNAVRKKSDDRKKKA